jgi:hypothetical protein
MGPQLAAITARWCDIILFGGARGGGKSDMLLGDFLQDVEEYGAHWQGILFRKSVPELEEIIKRSQALYPATGAVWRASTKEWIWPNKARLRLRHIERVEDAMKYQGHQYTWVGFDELGNWANDAPFHMVMACIRGGDAPIPVKRLRCSANPGGPGHTWVKRFFQIDDHPDGYHIYVDPATKMKRMFIPSRVQDNKILMDNDPNYVNRLKGVGSPELVQAWLDGNWDVILGAYFPEFDCNTHVIEPFPIPREWTKFGAMDWGSSAPFVFGWFAVADGKPVRLADGSDIHFPEGALIQYRELYGGDSGKGWKLDVEEVADMVIAKMSPSERLHYSVADPSMFKVDGGPSHAERCYDRGLILDRGDNTRIPGWDALRSRLRGFDSKPMLYLFNTCEDTIRTIPSLQHDERNREDVDTQGDDHCGDMLRYACMSRPYVRATEKRKRPARTLDTITLDELWGTAPKAIKHRRI